MSEHAGQIRILCVDDERSILQALERSFLDENYEIVNANSGAEGLQALEEEGPFQVVISDYRMPVMNGVEFLKRVYARWPDTVRLVLSGYADVGAIVAAINEGHIYKFIPKPWDDQDLRFTIEKSLEHYLLQNKNRELQEQLDAAKLALEKNMCQHTEQRELCNQVLEYPESILAGLPAGVVVVDEQGVISYCNDHARKLLDLDCRNTTGADEDRCRSEFLCGLAEQAYRNKTVSTQITLGGTSYRVRGRIMACGAKEVVILVFLETEA
jgi:two-component system NtrC family sensor kinase